ncbi:hypothetical protein VSS74_26535 [Conexibacter stalactiti]|uniref:Uncharacterized protein n=1 Tax=Conexibacter stalactiti TaxID=1940611 RepID=A0ABU4HX86_9ACTN|nr:hypothetical protein [Conexibacter stalactiti]MDW5597940.1 hypothetical protein [Conexibacter stalactiti]MEC5038582.1 hypothetical protein [Conexibacter stalactiti]
MASWDVPRRPTTAAFRDFDAADRDLRTALRLGLRFAEEAYERLWAEAGRRAGGGRDQRAVFEQLIDGLWQPDYQWAQAVALLGDAVTNYETYVERSHAELTRADASAWAPAPLADASEPPPWDELRATFARLDVEIEPAGVERGRRLRRLLALRRGELRTEQLRGLVRAPAGDLLAVAAALDAHDVIDVLDALARAAEAIDPVVVAHAAGGRPAPEWI